jgi:serine/threonine-protein kinase HipA
MQMARQVFQMDVAGNALVFFRDGEPAYLTRRFDRDAEGRKSLQEDFAQLAQRSEASHGRSYKYGYSYEGMADLMRRCVGPYPIEAEKFFERVLFNYLVRNGDAHLKDFALISAPGHAIHHLSPAFGLINTRLHLSGEKESALALFKDGYESDGFKVRGFHGRGDLLLFAGKIGIRDSRAAASLDRFMGGYDKMAALLERSYLSTEAKAEYLSHVRERMARLSKD